MAFLELFVRLLPWRPWPALAALYWHLTRRRVRARNRLLAAIAPLPIAYDVWRARVERAPDKRRPRDAKDLKGRFSIVQHGPTGSGSLAKGIADADRDYVLLLRAGDLIAPTAFDWLADALEAKPDALLLYGDEDELESSDRRVRPWFKPEWNEELFFAQDYLSGAVVIKTSLAREVATGDMDIHAFLLAATAAAKGAIVHVPHILSHAGLAGDRLDARLPSLAHFLEQKGATCEPGPFGTAKVNWPLPAELPLVSVIIPTKDKLELLEACVSGLLERTEYKPLEILIVDNGSVEPATKDYLSRIAEDPHVRVIPYPAAYNFSAINNFAVREAKGAYLCLLNNDTEVVGADWLTEMMRYAVRDDVGAVGAKLLYEDGSIQHAGVAIGIGEAAGHSHRFLPNDDPGYFALAHCAHFVSAVTAACLVVDKRKYLAVGGLDEENLAVAFNDVDFCLKLQAAGWRNVYTPHAVLVHHESKSRGSDFAAAQVERFRRELKVLQDRWGTRTARDPLHNPNLDRYSETFVLRL